MRSTASGTRLSQSPEDGVDDSDVRDAYKLRRCMEGAGDPQDVWQPMFTRRQQKLVTRFFPEHVCADTISQLP